MAENSFIYQVNHNPHCLQTLIDYQKNQPFFYFKVKLILNRNNSFTLTDKVLAIGKNNMYVFWAEEQQPAKYKALNTANKQGIDFALIQNPQQKIPLSKFQQFTLVANTDPQYMPYIKSLVPSFSIQKYPDIAQCSSLLFMKSLQDFQTHCVLCETYSQGLQLLYALELMKSLKDYEQALQKDEVANRNTLLLHKSNLKLMLMICNLKFGFLNASPDCFGYNFQGNYSQEEQRKQMNLYNLACHKLLKNSQTYQFAHNYTIRLHFKIIDEGSKQYASSFLSPFKTKTERLTLKACQLIEEMFQSLIMHIHQQTLKDNKFYPSSRDFPNLKYLNLTENKLTDNIFAVFQRLIFPQAEKDNKKASKALISAGSSSKAIQPLFPSLTVLDLSKNYITLQSLQTHKTLVRVLQNLSQFILKISLRYNKIKSLQFFDKYFLKTDTKSNKIHLNIPVEFIDLKDNANLSETKKQAFIDSYMERVEQLEEKAITEIGFVVDLGTLMNTGNVNVFRYLVRLRNYVMEERVEKEFEERNEFDRCFRSLVEEVETEEESESEVLNPSANSMTFALSRPASNQPLRSPQQTLTSSSDPHPSPQPLPAFNPILHRTSTQSREQLLTQLAKLFYLRDYKQLQLYKQQVKQNHQLTEQSLLTTFAKEYEQKRIEEKRILQLFDQVVNCLDLRGAGVRTLQEERLINGKLDRLVGIVRRKGLEGSAPQLAVYLKYLRDKMLDNYLAQQQGFDRINPLYDLLKNIKTNHKKVYEQAIQQGHNIIDVDYKELSNASREVLEKRFFDNKASPQMDQPMYDRLKCLLVERNLSQGEVVSIAQTLIKQLKLLPARAIRVYQKAFNPQFSKYTKLQPKAMLKAKQKLTSTTYSPLTPTTKMQLLRQFPISHYPFHPTVRAQTQLSNYEHPLTCLTFPSHLHEQALSFITIVNNFITFLYYTPQMVSQQTVTYINYIVTYLNDLQLESFQDLQWKEFLIQEMYVHLMAFRPQHKLAKGVLLWVMVYFTARLICRVQLEKFILAFLLENQQLTVDGSHLVLNSLSKTISPTPQSSAFTQRQTKISWTIPNQFLLNSFSNQGKLSINLRLDTSSLITSSNSPQSEQIEILCHETMTISELVSYVMDENNGIVGRLILQRKLKGVLDSSEVQELQKYWLFEKVITSNKLQHYKPHPSHKYVGEIVSESFENEQKITFYLRKSVTSHHYHNKNYLSYELNETQLLAFFNKIVSNIKLSIDILSKLPQQMTWMCYYALTLSGSGSYTPGQLVNIIFAHILCIYYTSEVNRLLNPKSPTSQLPQDDIDEVKEELLHKLADIMLSSKPTQANQVFIVNCKTFTIEDKLQIINKAKEIYKNYQQSRTTLSDHILTFVNCLGDLAYYETLVSDQQIILVNSRYVVVAKLQEHTNELNEIVNIYSKLEYFLSINQMTDLRLLIQEADTKTHQPTLSIETMKFDDITKSISLTSHQITGHPYFVLCAYNLIIAICKNIIQFDTKLLYEIQQSGLGTTTKKRNSKKLQFYNHNEHKTINALYQLPQNALSFTIVRNKQNQNYQKLSQNNSKQTLKKQQSQPLIANQALIANHALIANKVLNEQRQQELREQIDIKQVMQEVNEVYSRKSSKRSLKSNNSQRSVRRSSSRHQSSQQNHNTGNEESQSLIPSRKSIYEQQLTSPKQGNQPSVQKPFPSPINQQIDTQSIIKKINDDHKQPSQQVGSKSQDIPKPVQQSEEVVTNQQRKSRREIPKRRSSRESSRG